MLSRSSLSAIAEDLNFHSAKGALELHPVSGGDINDAYTLKIGPRTFFMKINSAERYPGMFAVEAEALDLLRSKSAFAIPQVIGNGIHDDIQYLVLEYLEAGHHSSDYWEIFAQRLADLHKQTANEFGLMYSNYIGSIAQANEPTATWVEFFINWRLRPVAERAHSAGKLPSDTMQQLDKFYPCLPEIFPVESPALVHGDLWSGNFMCGKDGQATIYDPAVYYGHREMDLAMSRLFGGFDPRFYSAYHEQFPLVAGWEERVDIHNLYPLLVHVILFGGGYVSQIQSILNRFSI